jgi:hypothetical protein
MIGVMPSIAVAQPIGTGAGPQQHVDPVRARGRAACGGDSRRMCRSAVEQGDMAVLGCLQNNEKKLSAACRKFLKDQGQLF